MCFGIKDNILQGKQAFIIIREEKIEIFERFGQPERFHIVSKFGRQFVGVGDGGESGVGKGDEGVGEKGGEDFPADLAVDGV